MYKIVCISMPLREYACMYSYDYAEIYNTCCHEFSLIQMSLERMTRSVLRSIKKFQHMDGTVLFVLDIMKGHEEIEECLRRDGISYTPVISEDGITSVDLSDSVSRIRKED